MSHPGHAADAVGRVVAALAARIPQARVVDVGGGSGMRAVPLAVAGCRVTVVDASIDALAILRRRAADAGVSDRVEAVQADADRMSDVLPTGQADLVLCHHLLEVVDDPAAAVLASAVLLKPGGTASVVTASRYGAVIAQALAGRHAEAVAMLAGPDGRFGPTDPLRRRFDAAGLFELLTGAGLQSEQLTGVGAVAALTPGTVRAGGSPPDEEQVAELDAAIAAHPLLRDIGTDLHAVAVRPGA